MSAVRKVKINPSAGSERSILPSGPGEYASATPKTAALVLGDVEHLQVRADVDEQNAARLQPGQTATADLKGDTTEPIELRFVGIEPYVVPKVSLTGASTERVDTRVTEARALARVSKADLYRGISSNGGIPEIVSARIARTVPSRNSNRMTSAVRSTSVTNRTIGPARYGRLGRAFPCRFSRADATARI